MSRCYSMRSGTGPVDELSAEPDVEVVNAVRPSMATIPNAILLCALSSHARKGVLFDAHRKHYGQDGDPILVWQADTRVDECDGAASPTSTNMLLMILFRAAAEYLAQFRSDLEGYISARCCISLHW